MVVKDVLVKKVVLVRKLVFLPCSPLPHLVLRIRFGLMEFTRASWVPSISLSLTISEFSQTQNKALQFFIPIRNRVWRPSLGAIKLQAPQGLRSYVF